MLKSDNFDGGTACGVEIIIDFNGSRYVVTVLDECPFCVSLRGYYGHECWLTDLIVSQTDQIIDVTECVFSTITGDLSDGIVDVEWSSNGDF